MLFRYTTLIALLSTFLFTACVERGASLHPAPVMHHTQNPHVVLHNRHIKPHTLSPKTASHTLKVQKVTPSILKSQKCKAKPKKIQSNTTPTLDKPHRCKQKNLFSLTEETKRNISGFFVLAIALIILL
jgi:hypothetical protein